MAIANVQYATGADSSTSTGVTWPGATTANNLLVGCIFANSGWGTTPTFSAPSGWSLIGTIISIVFGAKSNNTLNIQMAYKSNAASQSTTGTWSQSNTGANTPTAFGVIVGEYSGAATSTPLDVSQTSSGTSAAPATGTTGATAQAAEVAIGCVFQRNSTVSSYTSPTNGFAISKKLALGGLGFEAALVDKVLSATGAQSCAVTSDQSLQWVGAIATFKAASATGKLFRAPPLTGVGIGGPFFANPLQYRESRPFAGHRRRKRAFAYLGMES